MSASHYRFTGVLIPLFALRGENDLGMGDVAALREAADWCARNGFAVLQILPVNETGGDHSPYNILSAMALEPSTISVHPADLPDVDDATYQKMAASDRLEEVCGDRVDYTQAKARKWKLLEWAFQQFQKNEKAKKTLRFEEFLNFCRIENDWLESYGLYRALLDFHGGNEVMDDWPEAHRSYSSAVEWLDQCSLIEQERFQQRREFYTYVQWIAYTQWREVAEDCRKKGVALMGDIPVGVSLYSADVFDASEIFDTTRSSGAPPEKVFASDPFTMKWGQNWGFPLYKWEAMERDDYAWWRRRLRLMRSIFHLLRVDHALGFFRIYSFPWRPDRNGEFLPLTQEEAMERTGGRLPCFMVRDDSSLENRLLNREQGKKLFQMILEEIGAHRIIAEDLGEVAPYIRPVLRALEIPTFKIPQWERREDGGLFSGEDYTYYSLATYATHDHDPLCKMWEIWMQEAQSEEESERQRAIHSMWELLDFSGYGHLSLPREYDAEVRCALIGGLYRSASFLAISMITDIFGLDFRFNIPGAVSGENWTTRLSVPVSEWDTHWKSALADHRRLREESGRQRSWF